MYKVSPTQVRFLKTLKSMRNVKRKTRTFFPISNAANGFIPVYHEPSRMVYTLRNAVKNKQSIHSISYDWILFEKTSIEFCSWSQTDWSYQSSSSFWLFRRESRCTACVTFQMSLEIVSVSLISSCFCFNWQCITSTTTKLVLIMIR